MANKQLVSLQFPDLSDTYTINGLPSGGSSGQVLAKSSNSDYAVGWVTPSAGVSPYTSNPAMDGTASAGSSANYARGDHVHPSDTSKADKVTEESYAGTEIESALVAGKIYHFSGNQSTGVLSSLTITGLTAPASGQLAHYHFDFDSGSPATTLTLPNTVTMPSGFTVEASTRYEIDILNGYGVVMSWAVS